MPQYHWPVRDLEGVELKALGSTDDGYDYFELTGGIAVSSDNLVYVASFFLGLGSLLLESLAEQVGMDTVITELNEIEAGLPFREPAPEPHPELPLAEGPPGTALTGDEALEALRRHPSAAPDIEGRDV